MDYRAEYTAVVQFLSTPSARRATITAGAWSSPLSLFLSTPSARRATAIVEIPATEYEISIHALREEGDGLQRACIQPARNFYPRPPRGGRPHENALAWSGYGISIHALREEGDATTARWTASGIYFYPRPPRGGRR